MRFGLPGLRRVEEVVHADGQGEDAEEDTWVHEELEPRQGAMKVPGLLTPGGVCRRLRRGPCGPA